MAVFDGLPDEPAGRFHPIQQKGIGELAFIGAQKGLGLFGGIDAPRQQQGSDDGRNAGQVAGPAPGNEPMHQRMSFPRKRSTWQARLSSSRERMRSV